MVFTSLAIYTIYAHVSCVVQLPSKCILLKKAIGLFIFKVQSGGCISASKLRQMAKYMDKLINVYAKMNMSVHNNSNCSI